MDKYTENIAVKSYHTNQYGKASITSLFNILIEAAWAHAQVMDWGYDSLKSNNLFWVLSRMYFQVEKYPAWQDQITLNTWSAGTDGMYAFREYIIEDQEGNVLLRAGSAWLILDMENHKIFRLSEYRSTFPKLTVENACRIPQRIKPLAHPVIMNYYPVVFSDLDINQHFNSVKYVERVLDNFSLDFMNGHEPAELEVNYLKEGQAGDEIAVTTNQISESETIHSLVRQSDNADLCVMKIEWRERNK